ncbi:MAG: hypothetical protein M1825_005305 [Sarcosagium campestre]|nr:MAG: hypothetical protein M1825_005305 [Sarcosagium campestre]
MPSNFIIFGDDLSARAPARKDALHRAQDPYTRGRQSLHSSYDNVHFDKLSPLWETWKDFYGFASNKVSNVSDEVRVHVKNPNYVQSIAKILKPP